MLIAVIAIICIVAIFLIRGLISKSAKNSNKYMVYIEGMMCAHCKAHVEKAFSDAGFSAKVDLENKRAELVSEKELTEDEIKAIIEKAGYTFVKCE